MMDGLIKVGEFDDIIDKVDGFFIARYNGFYFESVFQPVMSSCGHCLGYEALVRIKEIATGKNINPYCFFASRTSDLETTNYGTVCYSIHVRNFSQSPQRALKLFINISPVMFSVTCNDPDSVNDAIARITSEQLPPTNIIFEITEFEDRHIAGLIIGVERFRSFGIGMAIDDFGVDFSNEERVCLLKPDFIKLDKSLLDNYMTHGDPALIEGISLGKKEQATIIVEGVETKEQLDVLISLGVEFVQGYHFGRPEALTWIENDLIAWG